MLDTVSHTCGSADESDVVVTVAMPTRFRTDHALAALDSVLLQIIELPFEVLVLDNGVDPELADAVAQRTQTSSVSLRYVPVPAIGLHNARHVAAKVAAGNILVLVDDDIIAGPQWLSAVVEAFVDEKVQLVTGPIVPEYEVEPPSWIDGFWHRLGPDQRWCGHLSLLELGQTYQEIDTTLVFGANFAIRRQTLFDLGGFHPDAFPWELRRFRGDGETAVSVTARERGLKAVYHPGARVRHRVPAERMTVEYFERRSFLQGISDSFSDFRRGIDARVMQAGDSRGFVRRLTGSLRKLQRAARSRWSDPNHMQLQQRMRASHREGYHYHRRMMEVDPTVRQWVVRDDYWDADLSVGESLVTDASHCRE